GDAPRPPQRGGRPLEPRFLSGCQFRCTLIIFSSGERRCPSGQLVLTPSPANAISHPQEGAAEDEGLFGEYLSLQWLLKPIYSLPSLQFGAPRHRYALVFR